MERAYEQAAKDVAALPASGAKAAETGLSALPSLVDLDGLTALDLVLELLSKNSTFQLCDYQQ